MSTSGRLPTCVQFHKNETPESLMDRIARANSFYSLAEFCEFTGLPRAAIVAMDADHRHQIADWTGVEIVDLMKFANRSEKIIKYGSDRVRKTQLRATGRRYCPRCFALDLERGSDQSNARIYMRATWRFNMISDCPEHHLPLNDLPDDFDLLDLRDFAVSREPELEGFVSSPHNGYFSGRLLGRVGGSYLDSMPVYVAAELCAVLGALQQKMSDNKITEHVPLGMANQECIASGYRIASMGREAIWDFLTSYVVKMVGRATRYPMVYSLPLRWLRNELPEGDFALVRELFQEHAESHLPLETGEVFLEKVARRRVHTAYTAAVEYGLPECRIRDILINQDSGRTLITKFKGRSILFRRDDAHALLAHGSLQLTTKEAAERLGCAMTQMETLLSNRLLKFSTNGVSSGRIYRWVSAHEVQSFRERIGLRLSEMPTQHNLVPIIVATKVCRRIFAEIIALIIDGKLARACMGGPEFQLTRIMVDPAEIDGLARATAEEGYLSRNDAAVFLQTGTETIKHLIDMKLLSATVFPHKKTNLPIAMLRREELIEFTRQYVALDNLAKARKVRSIKVSFELKKLGVFPVYEGSRHASKVYRRTDIERVGF
ncbi:TniQ family protein [Agrobacterium sp. rho-13.3]|uniref:TniQ family protein n=1 Tax=Agrobacterium sp. rho-13.3 TaxID=3072980 RepID=UPI002A102EE6|nr:TniQ family protein [Agrobacterium sp. rho-13.3]MDX8306193.1 TniQ family protein [Agrobacterium sp. rho-13.3]MDX8307476.1 TniQ family protein [Agrobacterium sp. rho-13.3]